MRLRRLAPIRDLQMPIVANGSNGWEVDACERQRGPYPATMFQNPKRRGLARGLIVLGLLCLASCSGGSKKEVSYELQLSPRQAIQFKSDLSRFAKENGYLFIDGSKRTKEDREYINKETARSSTSAGLATEGQIIDVTLEPETAASFFIFAKSSAYDAGKVSLTIIYDETSVAEKRLADEFLQSQFLRSWTQQSSPR